MQYDYIIIGAGSAGAIIGSRLSEDPSKSVLLIESGPDYKGIDDLPEGLKYGYASTKSNWNEEHNWQYRAKGAQNTPIAVPRGKVTGGSSAINGQIFLRGIPEEGEIKERTKMSEDIIKETGAFKTFAFPIYNMY